MVLVRFQEDIQRSPSGLQLVRDARSVRPASILACGPDVQDVAPGMIALVNAVAGIIIGDQLLIPEHAILATL